MVKLLVVRSKYDKYQIHTRVYIYYCNDKSHETKCSTLRMEETSWITGNQHNIGWGCRGGAEGIGGHA